MKKFRICLTWFFLCVFSVFVMDPISIIVGLAISAAISYGTSMLINAITPRSVSDRGVLDQLQVQDSQFGKSIPLIWGLMRVPGNIIWLAPAFTDHIVVTGGGTPGGGKGGAKQPQYKDHTYSISFASMFCAGPIAGIKKIYADTRLIYNADTDPTITHAVPYTLPDTTLTAYFGYEDGTDGNPTQDVNASIQAETDGRLGPGSTSANRGIFYIYFNEFMITTYGNRIPSITVEIDSGTYNLQTVVTQLYTSVGLETTDLELSALGQTNISGALLDDNTSSVRDLLEALMNAYNFELPEFAGKVNAVFLSDRPALTIPFTDLGAYAGSDSRPVPLERSRARETDLPSVVNITYIAPSRDYQQNSMPSNVQVSQSQQHLDFSLNLALTDDQAKAIAEIRLQEAWLGRDTYAFAVPYKYASIAVADKILVQDETGILIEMKVVSVDGTVPGALKITAVRHETLIYTQLGVGDSGSFSKRSSGSFALGTGGGGGGTGGGGPDPDDGSPGYKIVGPGANGVLKAVPHNTTDALTTGFYAAMNPAGQMLVEKVSGSGTYTTMADFPNAAVTGKAISALPSVTNPGVWDRTNTLVIATDNGVALNSLDEADLIADDTQNKLLFESGEYIQFANATLYEDPTLVPRGLGGIVMYRIDTLLRGRHGSEYGMSLHTAGEKVYLVDAAVKFVEHDDTMLGKELNAKFVPYGMSEDNISPVAVTFDGASLLPLSPTHVEGSRNGGGDLHITWVRRSRTPSTFRRRTAIPIAEEFENYVIDVIGLTVTRPVVFSNLTGGASLSALSSSPGATNYLTKTGGTGWNAGAVDNTFFTPTNGALDIMLMVDEPSHLADANKDYAVGWTTSSSVTSYTDLDYCFVILPFGFGGLSSYEIFESGVTTGHTGTSAGAGYAIKISGGVISYIVDGSVVYSHAVITGNAEKYRLGGAINAGGGLGAEIQNARADTLVVYNMTISGGTSTDFLAATQTTIFGSPQSSIEMNIYQLSSTNHKGYPAMVAL